MGAVKQVSQAFVPSRGSHALTETLFYLQFAPEIDSDAFAHIDAQSADIALELPRKTEMKRWQFVIRPDGTQVGNNLLGGVEFARIAPNGAVTWLLRFAPDGLSVHCLDYTRWDEVWPMAQGLLLKALSKVPSGVGIAGVGMKNVDRFTYEGDLASYRAEDLIRRPNEYVAEMSFSSGYRWHCHTGWFQKLADIGEPALANMEVLNQLNVGSGPEVDPSGSKTIVTIDHNMLLRPPQLGELGIDEQQHEWLNVLMGRLHSSNKKVLSAILTDVMGRRINLAAEERK